MSSVYDAIKDWYGKPVADNYMKMDTVQKEEFLRWVRHDKPWKQLIQPEINKEFEQSLDWGVYAEKSVSLHDAYKSYEEFADECENIALDFQLGYDSPAEAWDDNPVVIGKGFNMRKAENSSGYTKEMREWFETRTNKHIEFVRQNLMSLAKKGFITEEEAADRGAKHDASKFEPDSLEGYIWNAWYHKNKDAGFQYPEGVKELVDKATKNHVNTEPHHPDSHEDVDSMSDLDMAEMVADWMAMSQELGTSIYQWVENDATKRFKFDDQNWQKIYDMITAIKDVGVEEYKDKKGTTEQEYKERVETLEGLKEFQASDPVVKTEEYFHGLLNGMELSLCILQEREPHFAKNGAIVWALKTDEVTQKVYDALKAYANMQELSLRELEASGYTGNAPLGADLYYIPPEDTDDDPNNDCANADVLAYRLVVFPDKLPDNVKDLADIYVVATDAKAIEDGKKGIDAFVRRMETACEPEKNQEQPEHHTHPEPETEQWLNDVVRELSGSFIKSLKENQNEKVE